MATTMSSIGLLVTNIDTMHSAQSLLSTLSTQLATEKKSQNMSDYAPNEAQNMMIYNASIARQNGYISVITTITTRITGYDSAMTGIEKIGELTATALATNQTYNPSTNEELGQQLLSYMKQVEDYLNTRMGDRYIFSGSRFSTPPVKDLATIPLPTTPFTVASPNLPTYDTEYGVVVDGSPAYVRDQVSISTSQKLSYGVTSTETGFQKFIAGLRLAYAATQDQANYATYMSDARTLIAEGTSEIRASHTRLSSANATAESTKDTLEKGVNTLKGQITDIQGVDMNEISLKITTYKATLEAAYAAIAAMTKLSVLNYI